MAEFKTRWWEPEIGRVARFGTSEIVPFRSFMDHFWDRPGPPCLSTSLGWPHADRFSGRPERLRAEFLGRLASLLTTVDLESELVSLEFADWPSEPWTMGSVSVVPAGRYRARADLALPRPPLFWAGEATNIRGHAECVHGALESGRRAALEVIHATQPMYASDDPQPLDWWEYSSEMRVTGL